MQISPHPQWHLQMDEYFKSVVHKVLQGKRDGWIALGPCVMVLWNTW